MDERNDFIPIEEPDSEGTPELTAEERDYLLSLIRPFIHDADAAMGKIGERLRNLEDLLTRAAGKIGFHDQVNDALLERIQALEEALTVSTFSLCNRMGAPLDHETKVDLAKQLNVDWESTVVQAGLG